MENTLPYKTEVEVLHLFHLPACHLPPVGCLQPVWTIEACWEVEGELASG